MYEIRNRFSDRTEAAFIDFVASIAAQMGNDEAQYDVGRLCISRDDDGEGEVWLKAAAEQGNPVLQYELGVRYDWIFNRDALRGKPDQTETNKRAFYWFKLAAEQGHALAARMLAQCYRLGRGVDEDLSASEYWYKKAADGGEGDNLGLATLYLNTERPELAVPLLQIDADRGLQHARLLLREAEEKIKEKNEKNKENQ